MHLPDPVKQICQADDWSGAAAKVVSFDIQEVLAKPTASRAQGCFCFTFLLSGLPLALFGYLTPSGDVTLGSNPFGTVSA